MPSSKMSPSCNLSIPRSTLSFVLYDDHGIEEDLFGTKSSRQPRLLKNHFGIKESNCFLG